MPYEAARLIVTVGAETREAESALRDMGQKVDGFSSSLKSGLLQGAGVAAFNTAIQGLSASMGVLKAAGVDYNNLLEQTRIAFTAMMAPTVNGMKDMAAGAQNALAMMTNLREFAAKTPFEFPELVQNAQRLMAMGFAAEEVIPQLEAIGNVSAAFGKGTEGINRMSLALGQMSAATVVHKEDLNQLIDVGVPVWDILAEKTGKSATELQDLVSKGEIASDFFIKAFNDWAKNNFGDMMAQQARTFAGALSNVQDALRDTIANMALPLFTRLTEGFVALGDFLGSDRFKLWASAGAASMESVGQAFDGLMQTLAPLGAAIGAVFDKLSEGDVSGAMASLAESVAGGVQNALDTVNAFGEGMFGAGWNLITQLGSGMAEAFSDAIDVVAEGLAALAAMLIGQSPPPEGPLKDIDKGGAAAGKAWGDPFGMMLKAGAEAGVTGVKAAVESMKDASKDVAAQMRDIDSASRELDRTMRGVRTQIDSIKDGFAAQTKEVKENAETARQGYQDAIAGVRDQMSAISAAVDEQTEALQRQIETIKDQYETAMSGVRDEIDRVKEGFDQHTRAAQDQIEEIKDRYTEAVQSVRDKIDGIKESYEGQTRAVQAQIDEIKDRYSTTVEQIKTKIDGIKDRYSDQTASVQDQIESVRERYSAMLDSVRSKIDEIKARYEDQAQAVQKQIDTIKSGYGSALDGVRGRMDAIKKAAEAVAGPLQAQITATRNQVSALREQEDIQRRLQSAATAQLRLKAMGDPALRGMLAGQLASLGVQDEILSTTQEMAEAQEKLADPSLTATERIRLNLRVQQLEIQKRLATMVDQGSLAEAVRQETVQSAQEAQLRITREIEDANRRIVEIPIEQKIKAIKEQAEAALLPLTAQLERIEAAQKAALGPLEAALKSIRAAQADALEPLQARLKQIEKDQKAALDPLQDRLKAIKREQEDALKPLQDQLKRLESDQKAALDPLQDKIKAIKREQEDALKPLQDQLKGLDREQRAALEPLQDRLKQIKREEQDALKPLQDRLKQLERDQKAAIEPLTDGIRNLKAAEKDALAPLQARVKDLERESIAAARTFDNMLESIQRQQEAAIKPLQDQLAEYQKQKEALAVQKEQLADIKRGIDEAAQAATKAAKDATKNGTPTFSLKPGEQRVTRKPLDPNAQIKAEDLKKAGADLADKLVEGFKEQLEAHIGAVTLGAIGAAIGGLLFGPIGAIVGGALGAAIGEKLQAKLAEMGITPDVILDSLSALVTKIRDDLAPAFELFLTNANELFALLKDNREVIAGIVAGLSAFLILGRIAAIVTTVVAVIGPLIAGIKTVIEVSVLLGAILTETGSLSVAFGAAMTALSGPVSALIALLGGPLTLILAAVALAIGVLTAAWVGNWGGIQEITYSAIDAISDAFSSFMEAMQSLGRSMSDLPGTASRAWDSIKTGAAETWGAIKGGVSSAWDSIKTAVNTSVSAVGTAITTSWDAIRTKAGEVWGAIKTAIVGVWLQIPEDIREDLVKIYNNLSERFGAMLTVVSEKIGAVKTFLADTWGLIVTKTGEQIDAIKTAVTTRVDAIKKYVSDRWGEIKTAILDTWQSIVDRATPIIDTFKRGLADAWDAIKRTADEKWSAVLRFFDTTFGDGLRKLGAFTQQFVTDWGTWAGEMLTKAKDAGTNIVKGLYDGANSLRQWLVDQFWDLVRFFLGKIKEILGIASPSTVFFDYGKSLIDGLIAGVKSVWDGASGFLEMALGMFRGFLSKVLEVFGIGATGGESSVFNRAGSAIVTGFKSGVDAIWTGSGRIIEWIGGLVSGFVSKVLEVLGIGGQDGASSIFTGIGGKIVSGFKSGIEAIWNGQQGIVSWVGGLITEFVGRWYTGFGWRETSDANTGTLKDIGSAVINAFWNGLKQHVAGLLNWLKTDVIDKIPEVIRKALGIESPSRVMFDLGVHTMQGLINGLQSKLGHLNGVQGLISKLIGGMGGRGGGYEAAPEQVRNWLLEALHRERMPESWLPALEIIARGESTNNPMAFNETELFSGGKSLGHATGLMQVAQGTFDWLAPGMDIWNPVDNAVAALRWIKFKYGDAFSVPGVRSILQGGPYLPYRGGGVTTEDIVGQGTSSGRGYVIHRDEGIFNAEQMRRLAPVGALGGGRPAGPTSVTNVTLLGNLYGYQDFETQLVRSNAFNRARGRDVNIWNPGAQS